MRSWHEITAQPVCMHHIVLYYRSMQDYLHHNNMLYMKTQTICYRTHTQADRVGVLVTCRR